MSEKLKPTRSICLRDWEALAWQRALKENRPFALARPVILPRTWNKVDHIEHWDEELWRLWQLDRANRTITSPLGAPGWTLAGKEAFCLMPGRDARPAGELVRDRYTITMDIVYSVDRAHAIFQAHTKTVYMTPRKIYGEYKQRAASRMPRRLCRNWMVVGAVKVVRVNRITNLDSEALGFHWDASDWKQQWNIDHPNHPAHPDQWIWLATGITEVKGEVKC